MNRRNTIQGRNSSTYHSNQQEQVTGQKFDRIEGVYTEQQMRVTPANGNPYHRASRSNKKHFGSSDSATQLQQQQQQLKQQWQNSHQKYQKHLQQQEWGYHQHSQSIQESDGLSSATASFGHYISAKGPGQFASRNSDYNQQRDSIDEEPENKYLRDKTNIIQMIERSSTRRSRSRQNFSSSSGRRASHYEQHDSSSRREDYADQNDRLPQKTYSSSSNLRSLDHQHHHRPLSTLQTQKSRDQEIARMARQRIDMQTISEPALVSPPDKKPNKNSSPPSLKIFDRVSFDAEAEYSGLETRPSIYKREDSLDSTKEHRIKHYMSKEEGIVSKSSSLGQRVESNYHREKNAKEDNFQKQAFKSGEQFQMNRNNHVQSRPSTTLSGGGHMYSQTYASRQSHRGGHGGNHSRSSKPRTSDVSCNGSGKASANTIDQHNSQHTVANFLLAQPSQHYGVASRRDDKDSLGQHNASTSSHQLQYANTQQTGVKRSNQGEKHKQTVQQQQQMSQYLLHITSLDGYLNQLQSSGGIHGFNNKTEAANDALTHQAMSKQQIIQNLNQRYLSQNQSINGATASQQQPTPQQMQSMNFEQTNLSGKVSESIKQTASRSKTRHSGKSQTQQQSTPATGFSHHSGGQKQSKSTNQAKTSTTQYPRKSSTTCYVSSQSSIAHASAPSKVTFSGSGPANSTLYSTNRPTMNDRPSTSTNESIQQRNNVTETDKTFTGGSITGHSQMRFADTVPSSKNTKHGKQNTSNSQIRSSNSGHKIQGRNLNSNHASLKTGNKTSSTNDFDNSCGGNQGTIHSVNIHPQSQFGPSATNTSYQRSNSNVEGHTSMAQQHTSSQQQQQNLRPSTVAVQRNNSKPLASTKSGSSGHIGGSKQQLSVQQRNSHTHSSALGTAKNGTRISHQNVCQGRNSIQGASKQVNLTHHMIIHEERDPNSLDLLQIEDILKNSQKSNIFSNSIVQTADSHEPSRTIVHDADEESEDEETISMPQKYSQKVPVKKAQTNTNVSTSIVMNNSSIIQDVSITSPTATPETLKKAKLRLETVCLLLAERTNGSHLEREKQQAAMSNVLDEVIFNQPNKYDQKCLRLLMDFQQQAAGNQQTFKLQEELAEVKVRFEKQTQLTSENKELREQVAKYKFLLQEQERQMRKIERELMQLKTQYEVDDHETRIRGYREPTVNESKQPPERAASQPSRKASVLVPLLDLSKVKGYEEHLRDKQAAQQKQKEKAAAIAQQKAPQKSAGRDPSGKKGTLIDKSGSGGGTNQKQMQTIQHKSTKVNNFMAAEEVQQTIMDNFIALNNSKDRPASRQANNSVEHSKGLEHRSINSHSLSPRSIKGSKGGRNHAQNYLSHMRHSHEQQHRIASNYYSGSATGVNASFDQVRQQHNYSATIESCIDERPNGGSTEPTEGTSHGYETNQLMQRKRSMPPAQVHIPLLDFSKLHNKPQQPTQSRAASKAMQPKQSMNQPHHSTKQQHQQQQYSTIDPSAQTKSSSNKQFLTGGDNRMHGGSQNQKQSYYGTIDHQQQLQLGANAKANGMREFAQNSSLYQIYQKKRGSYEQTGSGLNQSLEINKRASTVTSTGEPSSKDGIVASQSAKIIAAQAEHEVNAAGAQAQQKQQQQAQFPQVTVYSQQKNSNANISNNKLSTQLMGGAQHINHKNSSNSINNQLQYMMHPQQQSKSRAAQELVKQSIMPSFKADFSSCV